MGTRRSILHWRIGRLIPVLVLAIALLANGPADAALPHQDGLVWPTRDAVTSDFNEQPCHTGASHGGYDMNVYGAGMGDRGEPIHAAFAGTVVQKVTSNTEGTYGNRLALRHQIVPGGSGTKYETFYAHLEGFASGLVVGTKVGRGAVIGYMGDSGRRGEVHLHFEIRRKAGDESSIVLGPGSSLEVDETIGCISSGDGARKNLAAKTPMNLRWSDLWVKTWWGLRNSNTAGVAEGDFTYERTKDVLVKGDWNGDGIDTPGVVRCNLWILNNGFDSYFDKQFAFGAADCSMKPVVGDWDGDDADEPGMVSGNTWFLNYGLDGSSEASCTWASSTHTFLGGDWNGGGVDSPGTFAAGTWFFNNACDSTTDFSISYGLPGDMPIVGNWDGGTPPDYGVALEDHPGVVRGNVWYLNHGFDSDPNVVFAYGTDTHTPFGGDWNNDVANPANDTPMVGAGTT